MVWGLVSDVHGNYPALVEALGVLERAGATRLAFLGDYLGRGDSDGCVARIREVADVAVVGNRDLDWQDRVGSATRAWVLSLPRQACVDDLLFAHGDARLTPALSTAQIGKDFGRAWLEMERQGATVWAFGHSHFARTWRKRSAMDAAEALTASAAATTGTAARSGAGGPARAAAGGTPTGAARAAAGGTPTGAARAAAGGTPTGAARAAGGGTPVGADATSIGAGTTSTGADGTSSGAGTTSTGADGTSIGAGTTSTGAGVASIGSGVIAIGADVISIEPGWRYFLNVGTTGLPFPGKGGPSVALVDLARGEIRHLPLAGTAQE
jgi:predicted phosphodiesterase